MKKHILDLLVSLLVLAVLTTAASAQTGGAYNGSGSTTHSNVTTAYGAGQLFANNTSGNAAASPVTIYGQQGMQLIQKAMVFSTGTNAPPTITLWLYSAPPTTTGLVDRSAYIGPYASDASLYLGALTCSTWNKTNDVTAQYFAECSGSGLMLNILPAATINPKTTIYVMEEIGGAYTPLAAERHSYYFSTLIGNN